MRTRRVKVRYKIPLTMFLIAFFLIGFTAGCGGGDQSGNKQNGGGKSSGNQSQQATSGSLGGGTGQKGKNVPETKTAVGKITNVNPENRKLVVKPSKGEITVLKTVPKARIELDGKEAKLEDIKKGQQVQVEYIVREGAGVPNRARSVTLFSDGSGGGGTS